MRSYIDYPQLKEFKDIIQHMSGMSKTYYFNRKKQGNGSCLIAVVLTRPSRKGPWTHVKVFYRVCELQKKLSADLILINKFINELPKEICDINQVTLHMAQAYVSGMFINGYFDYFGVPRKNVANSKHPWHKSLMSNYNRFFKSPDQLNNYKALQKMQMLYFKMTKFEPVNLDDLSIEGYFEGR
jgi:hypothetical protein